jgi:thioredoxin reductase (NADPH)
MTEHKTKVLIIGSGPAGYTAAIYAARANLQPIVVAGLEPGGQLTITTDVENYPGFAETIQGPWLMQEMRKQAENVGAKVIDDMISEVDFSKRPFVCKGDGDNVYIGDTVVICTGAQAKWLGMESETKFRGFGVSACATCDGFFFREEEALYMTNHASKVTLVHRRDELRAEKILQDRLFDHPKVNVIWDSVLEEVVGTENPRSVTGVKLQNIKTNEISELPVEGVFIAIGHSPNTKIFQDKIDLDSEGYIVGSPSDTTTSVSGVFAAGDVRDKVYRQAVTAAGQGCMGALDAAKYLQG